MSKSSLRRARPVDPTLPASFRLGRERFALISAVEGIALTEEMRATLERSTARD